MGLDTTCEGWELQGIHTALKPWRAVRNGQQAVSSKKTMRLNGAAQCSFVSWLSSAAENSADKSSRSAARAANSASSRRAP